MQKFLKHLLIGTVAISFCLAVAASFVVKKTNKKPSLANLKEQCCEELGALLLLFPDIMHAMADVQSVAIKTIQGYWEGDKQTLCLQATKDQLESCCKKLTALHEQMDQMKTALAQQASFLQGLESKPQAVFSV